MGTITSSEKLIAPCGMNCGICMAYLRERNTCIGCNGDDSQKPNQCVSCIIINCEIRKATKSGFCYECDKLPCRRLKQLDKRYRTKYKMSMLENLESIRKTGLKKFVLSEQIRWKCQQCGGTICVHRGFCIDCKN